MEIGVQIVCRSEKYQKPDKTATGPSITVEPSRLAPGSDLTTFAPTRTHRQHHSQTSNRKTFLFPSLLSFGFSPGTIVAPTSRLCFCFPSLPGHLHFAKGDAVDKLPLLESTSAFDDRLQFFIPALSVLLSLSLFQGHGHVLFVFGPSIFFGQAQQSVPVLFQILSFCTTALVHSARLFHLWNQFYSPWAPETPCAVRKYSRLLPLGAFFVPTEVQLRRESSTKSKG